MLPQKAYQVKSSVPQTVFGTSDDTAVMRNLQETHKPDALLLFDVRPILAVVENIFSIAAPTTVIAAPLYAAAVEVEDKAHHQMPSNMEALEVAHTIHRISCEIACRCSGSGEAQETTMVLLSGVLSRYAWDAKMVLVLAAFAMSYGEFWLTGQLHSVNPLANSVTLLKKLPDVLEHVEALKPRFKALNHLIKTQLGLARCVVEFNDLSAEHISVDTPALAEARSYIPSAVYWVIKSAIASSSLIIGLIGMSHEYLSLASVTWELESLTHKLTNMHSHLSKQLDSCRKIIDQRQQELFYKQIERTTTSTHTDNSKTIGTFFPSEDGCPFIHRLPSKKIHVDALRRKTVLILISDLHIMQEELQFLTHVFDSTHGQSYESTYEFIWLPIVDAPADGPAVHTVRDGNSTVVADDHNSKAVLELAGNMPWYTVHPYPNPNSALVRYIKNEWLFSGKKPILVVLDGQGKVTNKNALYMVYIWGPLAFPFSAAREEALWRAETLRMELLVDDFDPKLSMLISEGKYVCIYGGEDIEWIRLFTSKMKEIARATKIAVELVYVGKNHPKSPVKKAIGIINKENLSSCWTFDTIWFFWSRLESMMHSKNKMQGDKIHTINDATDKILQEVMTLLAYGNGAHGWALMSRGSIDMVRAEGPTLMAGLNKYNEWVNRVPTDGFVGALRWYFDSNPIGDHCVRLVLPSNSPVVRVSCPECRRVMERYLLFQCCEAPLVQEEAPSGAIRADGGTSPSSTVGPPVVLMK